VENIRCPKCNAEIIGPFCHMCGEKIVIKTAKEWEELEKKANNPEEKPFPVHLFFIALVLFTLAFNFRSEIKGFITNTNGETIEMEYNNSNDVKEEKVKNNTNTKKEKNVKKTVGKTWQKADADDTEQHAKTMFD